MPKQFEAVPRRCITHSHEVAQHQSSGGGGGGGERWRGVQHRTEETQFIKPRPRWPTVGTRLSAGGLGGGFWSPPGLADNNDFINKPPLLAL